MWGRLSSVPPLYLCDTFCISVFVVILIYQQDPTWITWHLKNGEWEFSQAKEQTGYEKRLPWMSQVQSTLSLQLLCIRPWASIAALWQSLLKGWACLAGAQILGANVAELSPRMKKFLTKSEIPQYKPQWGEREISRKNRQKLPLSTGRAHKIIMKGSTRCCISALN